jgi:hypothetical protein
VRNLAHQVLHEMLVNPPIAIVGISNWVLDPAKMNRACILQRPDPGEGELSQTARAIAGTLGDAGWLESLSTAFHEIYTHQVRHSRCCCHYARTACHHTHDLYCCPCSRSRWCRMVDLGSE